MSKRRNNGKHKDSKKISYKRMEAAFKETQILAEEIKQKVCKSN